MAKSVKVGNWIVSVFSSYEEGEMIKVKGMSRARTQPTSGVTQA